MDIRRQAMSKKKVDYNKIVDSVRNDHLGTNICEVAIKEYVFQKKCEEEAKKKKTEDLSDKKTFRNGFIRVSAENHVTMDNIVLGVRAGDVVRYTKEDIQRILEDWKKTKDFKYFL